MSRLERYSRQTLLAEIGEAGQERLLASSGAVAGWGALGSVIASTAGIPSSRTRRWPRPRRPPSASGLALSHTDKKAN